MEKLDRMKEKERGRERMSEIVFIIELGRNYPLLTMGTDSPS